MIRDGWPSFQEMEAPLLASKRWWERAIYHTKRYQYLTVSGQLCALAAWLFHPLSWAMLLGLGVYAGFYADSRHAAGQGPDDSRAHLLTNLPNLACSGATSLAPLALIVGWHAHDWRSALAILAAGLTKMLIWPFWWTMQSWFNIASRCKWITDANGQPESFTQPTRMAAMSFGAVIGAILAVIS